ncbi:MAG: hypothetical protein SVS85_00390, partial [Candidatus Nanohaloarchaea archaeon]|nr:hypothetical protein [Candidatus Nanohaloarchaea archaeon]
TSDRYLEGKWGGGEFQPFGERKEELKSFLRTFGIRERAELHRIEGFRGNAVDEGDALAVTGETRESGERINELRREKGRETLELVEVEQVHAVDGGPISSSRIREGEIDRNGLRKG